MSGYGLGKHPYGLRLERWSRLSNVVMYLVKSFQLNEILSKFPFCKDTLFFLLIPLNDLQIEKSQNYLNHLSLIKINKIMERNAIFDFTIKHNNPQLI